MSVESEAVRWTEAEEVTLGATLMGHDVSYTVLDSGGVPLLVAEEERYSRRKKGTFIPSPRQLSEILAEAGVAAQRVRHLALANIPELMERRTAASLSRLPPFGPARTAQAMLRAFVCQLDGLESVLWIRHHLCHAASAFLPGPFSSAAVITVDGMGEDETATIWHGQGTRLTHKLSIRHPHSLGYLYQAVAQWCGLVGAEREGMLMGLASLGTPRYLASLQSNFLASRADGTFAVAPELERLPCDNASWVRYCEQYFGPRRASDEEISEHHRDVAASVQALAEQVLLEFARLAARLTSERHACAAGGVFMNSMANGRLRREGPFEDLWIQPMASDNGLSLGAALWSYCQRHQAQPRWSMRSAYLGSELVSDEIGKIVGCHKPRNRPTQLEREVARLLADGKLVGWVQGRSEIGARALGHRSILADPRDPRTKDRVNEAIKLREPWRPFAPVVLEEEAQTLFVDGRPSPFMMFVSAARPGAPIPAALHVDGSARVQTVSREDNERLWRLLREFKELTGVGALLNTSFNVRGEPIVRTAGEAYRIFVGSGMDALVLDDDLLEKAPDTGHRRGPVEAAAPLVRVSTALDSVAREVTRVAVVSLGSRALLGRVQAALAPNVVRVFQGVPSHASGDAFVQTGLRDERGRFLDASALPEVDLIVVLLPIWTEVASESVPNLLEPFMSMARARPTTRVLFLDEAGGAVEAEQLLPAWEAAGPRGTVSEVEYFWITRRVEG